MNFNSSFSNPSFGGRREDLKQIKSLTENNMPILTNKKQLILSAIDNVGNSGDKQDIEMLMGTVETMKYGIQNNSEFAKALGGEHGEKENTDWDGILQSTIQNAINGQSPEDKAELQARFQKIFGEEKPLTEEEKTMLQLRSDILSSKEMTNVISDPEKTLEAARVTQNLDYFISSSEINNEDKVKCLGMMKQFMSDDYEINPQLKDYKVQAFSEMLNDLIIKRPDEEPYTIKDVSQKQTGMCAAISIARKTITYEDKVRALEIMMNELDASSTMKVYDRTEIGTGKMVEIPKAHVDFTDGMKKGYRIVDTGTHQWMNAANVVGDGSITTAHYQAFDPENYEIFRDSKWLNDLPQEYRPAQNWLRYLQKEQGAVATAARRNLDISKVQKEVGEYKKDYQIEEEKAGAALRQTIEKLDPNMTDSQSSALTRKVLKADKIDDAQFKILSSDPKEVREAKLAAFLKDQLPEVSDETIQANIEKISGFRDMSTAASEKLSKLKEHSTPKAIFAYNKNLFTAAAHHRRSIQAELDVPERLSAYEKALNIPSRDGLIQDSANKVLNNLSSQAVLDKTAENFGVEANADAVKNAVEQAVTTAEVSLPAELDEALAKMGMGDRVTVVTNFLDDTAAKIQAGDREALNTFAENAHVRPDANTALRRIEIAKAELANNPSNQQISDSVTLLGYNNQIEMTADMYKTFADVTSQMSAEQLTNALGQDADNEIAKIGKNIKSIAAKQAQIERQLDLPTRKDIVLSHLEKSGEIVTEKTLQDLQAKFDRVAEVKDANDSRIVDPSIKKTKIPDSMYKFTNAEKAQFAQIESKLPSMRQYAKVNAKAVNEALEPQLNELYAEAGRLDGHLWVGGEGESGLFDNQSIKVFELITGKHYYNEEDIDKVVAHIKKGEGSGTSSTNVSHTGYSGHAQYVEEVSQVAVIDPETKETVMKDVLWHDNTWGKCENTNVWTDEKGVQRTDYGSKYGGPDGYVYNPHFLTGTFVEDQKVQVGRTAEGQKFNLWKATRIQGENPEASKKIDGVMNQILELGNAEGTVAEFEKAFKEARPVDFDKMDKAEAMMGRVDNALIAKLEKANPTTQADLDAMNDRALNFLLEKTAVQMSSFSADFKSYVSNIFDEESLAKVREQLPEIQKQMIASPFLKGKDAPKEVIKNSQNEILAAFNNIFADGSVSTQQLQKVLTGIVNVPTDELDGSFENLKKVMIDNANAKIAEGISNKSKAKELSSQVEQIITSTIDEKMSINSVEDLKSKTDLADTIISLVDDKFNTSSDEDLVSAFKKIQNMTNEEFSALLSDTTPEQLGLRDVKSIDVARQINALKGPATEQFQQNTRLQVLLSEVPQDENEPEWIYRTLNQQLYPVKYSVEINSIKKSYAQNQGVHAAFPEAEILSSDEINEQVTGLLSDVNSTVEEIKTAGNKGAIAEQLNQEIKNYISVNVAEKYQSKALSLVNGYVKALKNGSADADKYKEAATQVMSQAHITKFPTDMLKAYIREVQSENPNEEKLSTLRDYVTTAVEVSQIASVEYDLIDNASNGFETMTKQSFDNYKLTTSDGRQVSLDSDEGIMFLVNKLANPANGSTALQVFFAHTGLSEKAVDLISKSVDLDSIPVATEQLGGQLTEIFGDIKSLDGQFKEFSNEKSVAYSSYKDAVKHYVQVLDKEYANKSAQEKKVYNAYKQVLAKTQNADFAKNLPADQIVPTLEKIHKLAVQKVTDSAAGGIQQLNSLSEILSTRLSAMEALKVPQDSKEESVRKQFVEKGNAAYAQLAEIITQINELLV